MTLIKKLLFLVLILTIAGAGVYWAANQGYLKDTPLANISGQDLTEFAQDTSEQTKILGSRASETGQHIQTVLGESIQASDENQAIHEKAFEYGRYLYCKAVVEEYEQENKK
ncbi:MAG: hypothetical protein PVJ09_02730 [Candidatus Woesebacteria bacterium]|jgi:hypothetical protein